MLLNPLGKVTWAWMMFGRAPCPFLTVILMSLSGLGCNKKVLRNFQAKIGNLPHGGLSQVPGVNSKVALLPDGNPRVLIACLQSIKHQGSRSLLPFKALHFGGHNFWAIHWIFTYYILLESSQRKIEWLRDIAYVKSFAKELGRECRPSPISLFSSLLTHSASRSHIFWSIDWNFKYYILA